MRALKDYQLIFCRNEITNAEFRWFVGLESRKVAHKLLRDACVKVIARGKYSKYILPDLG
ncbi:hypothetical protein [Halobacillus sp. Nhm2S1]|uniref:hypothetical protein n=1 Tax=Halobacillus sp. Nhm2S1 TaxID=2866716 RepID=UPI001C7397CF|nr:hypothetical protein [Halobacillus sp. Nhm2S1]MBX0358015.1 hypothetical protein [Halobacillus sp. Nhm2S1]